MDRYGYSRFRQVVYQLHCTHMTIPGSCASVLTIVSPVLSVLPKTFSLVNTGKSASGLGNTVGSVRITPGSEYTHGRPQADDVCRSELIAEACRCCLSGSE